MEEIQLTLDNFSLFPCGYRCQQNTYLQVPTYLPDLPPSELRSPML